MKEDDLGPRGRAFWATQQAELEFDPHEEELLFEACRGLDTIATLSERVSADGLMVRGSQGQPVLHPAVPEIRQQQAQVARLLTQLNLETPELGAAVTARQAANRAAAQKRWRDAHRGTASA